MKNLNRKDLIVFTGFKQSGKSLASKYLFGVNQGEYNNISFADPLKKMLMALGLTYEQLSGSEKEIPCALLGGKTPRYAMQTLGTEWGRDMIWKNIWANAWGEMSKRHMELYSTPVTCDDVRFPNECEVVKELGGTIVRIKRPGNDEIVDRHESEIHIPDLKVDYTILNNGSIEDLYSNLHKLLESLNG